MTKTDCTPENAEPSSNNHICLNSSKERKLQNIKGVSEMRRLLKSSPNLPSLELFNRFASN